MTMASDTSDLRTAEIWTRLGEVTDPELDEPVTELGFVERVAIKGDTVEVDFRLPTYWCAANFAFLMVDDIRIAVEGAEWVRSVRPRLLDHMYEDEVNRAAGGGGRSFKEVFDDLGADDTLDDIRQKFRLKAFQRRQEMVLRALRRQGFDVASLVDMDLGTLEGISIEDEEGARQKPRYLRILREFGFSSKPQDLAFVTPEGTPLAAASFEKYLQELRGVRINMEFNGAICRGLLSTRYKEAKLEEGQEPALIDFIHGNVPPRGDAPTTA